MPKFSKITIFEKILMIRCFTGSQNEKWSGEKSDHKNLVIRHFGGSSNNLNFLMIRYIAGSLPPHHPMFLRTGAHYFYFTSRSPSLRCGRLTPSETFLSSDLRQSYIPPLGNAKLFQCSPPTKCETVSHLVGGEIRRNYIFLFGNAK